jgi:hypothetical protein
MVQPVLEDKKKRANIRQEIEKESLWEDGKDWRLFVHRPV